MLFCMNSWMRNLRLIFIFVPKLSAQAIRIEAAHRERKESQDEQREIGEIASIDQAARERLEMAQQRKIVKRAVGVAGEEIVEDQQGEQCDERNDGRNDGLLRQ